MAEETKDHSSTAQAGNPVDYLKSAQVKNPVDYLKSAQAGNPVDYLKSTQAGNPVDYLKSAQVKNPVDYLRSAQAESAADYEKILQGHGVRPTAMRLLVYRTMEGFTDTFSMADLEDVLETVDKSTIFRTLTLFSQQHLVHEIEDGSGSTKYCLCRHEECGPDDMHCHFYCESCHKTFCLDHTHIPAVRYPKGFQLRQIDYLLKGLCPDCARRLQAQD